MTWLQWARAQPLLAGAVLLFSVTAIGGLVLSVPPGFMSSGQDAPPVAVEPAASAPVAVTEDSAPTTPTAPTSEWVVKPASPPTSRGLALVYAYRALPPGGDSRFEWFVQIKGPRSLLDEVDHVRWRMDPPPKNDGGDLVSRDRAGDGFPLFGDGPGGWFGVSATVQFKDGSEETLSRRIDLPE